MVVVDLFIVRSATEQSRQVSIEALRQKLDRSAPEPRKIYCPSGEEMFVFAVDFHRRPLDVCRQMGFECVHLEFLDISLDCYTPECEAWFWGDSWVRVFQVLWIRTSTG
jgi:hypothetical protein